MIYLLFQCYKTFSKIIYFHYNKRSIAEFLYKTVKKEDLELIYDNNILKIRFKEKNQNFGAIVDLDQTTYEAYEIHFHTPGI